MPRSTTESGSEQLGKKLTHSKAEPHWSSHHVLFVFDFQGFFSTASIISFQVLTHWWIDPLDLTETAAVKSIDSATIVLYVWQNSIAVTVLNPIYGGAFVEQFFFLQNLVTF